MNIRRLATSLLAVAGFAVTMAASAHAQEPDGGGALQGVEWEEFSCVYSELIALEDDDYFEIVNVYMSQATEGDAYESALGLILPAVDACAAQHEWTADEEEIAMTMGIAGTVADAIEGYLLDEGFSEEELDDIISLVDTMSDDEVIAFVADDWRKDEAFKAGIAAQLAGKGVEGDAQLVNDCMVLLETYVIGMFQAEMWMSLQDG